MKNVVRCLAPASLFLLIVAACDSSTSSGSEPPATTPPDSPDAGSTDEPACPTTTTGPTLHEGDVADGEVWTAAASPHVITYDVDVRDGHKLTIEPCAKVLVKKGFHLNVAFPLTPNKGTLIAEGTAKRPITFAAETAGERWASLKVVAPGTARLSYVTFEGGGGGDFEFGASLVATGDGEDGSDPVVFVDHVTIKDSLQVGALFDQAATFIEGSKDFVVTGSGEYPLQISEHVLDRLPTGTYTGNKIDEIMVEPEGGRGAGTGFIEDGTVHDRGVPYQIGRDENDSLRIGSRGDNKLVTVTIEAGVVMKFNKGAALDVQLFTTEEPSTAALIVKGTAEKPVVLTSSQKTPAPGDWRGIWYGGIPGPTNKIDHLKIEYAGGDCACSLNTCSQISEHEGAIIFTAQPPSAFITNTTFANIAGHGITQGFDGSLVNFRPTNTFTSVSGCVQTMPRQPDTDCPDPQPACDGLE